VDAFAGFVAVALEADAFHVFEGVRLCARTEDDADAPLDGCAVGIVAARADRLVLAMVRSLYGSAASSPTT